MKRQSHLRIAIPNPLLLSEGQRAKGGRKGRGRRSRDKIIKSVPPPRSTGRVGGEKVIIIPSVAAEGREKGGAAQEDKEMDKYPA